MNAMNTFVLNGTTKEAIEGNNRELATIFSDATVVGKNIEKISVAIRTALKMHEISETESIEGFYVTCIDAVATLLGEIGTLDGWNNTLPTTANHDYYVCNWEFMEDNDVFRQLCRATANYNHICYREAKKLFANMANNEMLNEFMQNHPDYNAEDISAGLHNSDAKSSIKELLKDMYEAFKAKGVTKFGYEPTDSVQIDIEDIPVIIKML